MMGRDDTVGTGHRGPLIGPLAFLGTFVAAWAVLDLAPSPPVPVGALLALAGAGLVLVLGERLLGSVSIRAIPGTLGLGRPDVRVLGLAGTVGLTVFVTYLVGARLVDAEVELRSNWPAVLIGSLLFHGVAEELVWRGFAFGRCRATATFWRAVARTMPLIALTHVPIILTDGVVIGGLAVASAAVTCLPFAYLWERGGRTIWGAAVLHGLVGTWQLFERGYPASFSMVILLTSIVVPMSVFLVGDRFLARGAASGVPATPGPGAVALVPAFEQDG